MVFYLFIAALSFPLALLAFYPYYRQWRYAKRAQQMGFKVAPLAPGGLPFVGHGFYFSQDIYGYIQKCYRELGPVFRLQIYRSEFLVVCDRTLVKDYFKRRETEMSLYEALRRIYFGDAFTTHPRDLETIVRLVKATVRVDYDAFLPKIVGEAKSMIQRLREQVAQNRPSSDQTGEMLMDVKDEMIRFVARTSAQCFISIDLTEDFFNLLMKFTDRLNQLVVLTYFFPRWLIRATLGQQLISIRNELITCLDPVIESYRTDPNKKDSLVFRKSVDWVEKKTGRTLTNTEVGEVVICLLYVSSENTALGLTNLLIDLVSHPASAERVAQETRPYLETGDFKGLYSNTFLDNCLMESARLNTHIFPLNRQSQTNDQTLGPYWIGDTECVAICEPMLMKDPECAADVFTTPQKFKPTRFEKPTSTAALSQQEPKDPKSIMTWGAGVHLCPGKNFAIYEMKTAIALLLNTFSFDRYDIGPLEYFSPSAYAERSFKAGVELLPNPVSVLSDPVEKPATTERNDSDKLNGGGYLQKMVIEGCPVWLIRGGCSHEDQKRLYKNTIWKAQNHLQDRGADSSPLTGLQNPHSGNSVPENIAWPIGWDNLAYTGTSTIECSDWLEWARDLVTRHLSVEDLRSSFGLLGTDDLAADDLFDSVYVQLYSGKSSMKAHKDQHVNWGISVSLGASCRMRLGDRLISLHSGDVLICDFSSLEHSVDEIIEENTPAWFNPEVQGLLKEEGEDYTETYGRARCSVQIRDLRRVGKLPEPITDHEFLTMLRPQD